MLAESLIVAALALPTADGQERCGRVSKAVLTRVWQAYRRLPPALKKGEGTVSMTPKREACLDAVEADFDENGFRDLALAVAPSGKWIYLFGVFSFRGEHRVGLVQVVMHQGQGIHLSMLTPGSYRLRNARPLDQTADNAGTIVTKLPGIGLVIDEPLEREGFILGQHGWVRVSAVD
jgi:hypothetical protein